MFSRTSRILLVAALVLVGAYLLIERPRQHAEETNETQSERLASFDAASIDSVVLDRPQDTVRFTKSDSLWRMVEPLFDSAEHATIATLLDALNTADIDRDLGAEANLAPYGLDHPDVVITLAAAHRIVLQVALGKHTVDDAWCYARSTSGHVLLIPTDVHRASTLPRDAYRNRRVVDFQVRDVTGYALVWADGHGMQWMRRGQGWCAEIAMGDTIPGDSVAVEALLHRVRGLRVAEFVPRSDEGSLGSMSLWKRQGPLTQLQTPIANLSFYHGLNGSYWVTEVISGRTMVIQDDISDLFAHTVNELRDRRLLQFDPTLAQRITFWSPSRTGELVRAGGRWSFPNPALGRVNPEHAANFVRALRGLKWTLPGGEAARTGAHTLYRIEIMGDRDMIIDELTAGPYDATTRWVASRSSHGAWLIDTAALDDLAGRFARLKEP